LLGFERKMIDGLSCTGKEFIRVQRGAVAYESDVSGTKNEVGRLERGEPTMKKLLIRGILGLSSLFIMAGAATAPAEAQVVVKVGPTHHYHHRYRHVYYSHGHAHYRYYYR
jgi:hypothetical protein